MRSAEELWLETLQHITGRVAHELKGALNGVAMNIEVLRTRASRTDLPPGSLQRFADGSSTQNEAVIEMVEALLALGRPGRSPVDVVSPLGQIVALLTPVARADHHTLELVLDRMGSTTTTAPVSAVRLVLGVAVVAAVAGKADVRCTCIGVGAGVASPTVSIVPGLTDQAMDAEVRAVMAAAAIDYRTDGHGTFIVFPGG